MLDRFHDRPLSHSQLNSWEYSPAEWYKRYIVGTSFTPTPEMLFGNVVGDSIGTENSLVPDLKPCGVKEYPLSAEVEGIKLVGYADHWCHDCLTLHENKTSANPKRWTKRKADKHSQIDMYLLMLYHQDGVNPEQVTCYLNSITTRASGLGYRLHTPPKWQQFELTRRTLVDLDNYVEYVVATVKAMEEYIQMRVEEDALSTSAPLPPAFKGV